MKHFHGSLPSCSLRLAAVFAVLVLFGVVLLAGCTEQEEAGQPKVVGLWNIQYYTLDSCRLPKSAIAVSPDSLRPPRGNETYIFYPGDTDSLTLVWIEATGTIVLPRYEGESEPPFEAKD